MDSKTGSTGPANDVEVERLVALNPINFLREMGTCGIEALERLIPIFSVTFGLRKSTGTYRAGASLSYFPLNSSFIIYVLNSTSFYICRIKKILKSEHHNGFHHASNFKAERTLSKFFIASFLSK